MDARLILPLLLWTSSAAAAFDHAHPSWDALLKKHVVLLDGRQDSQLRYADMARERTGLKAYLQTLSDVSEREFEAWSRAEQMAFLINAYNAFTVEKVLTRYPAIASIWDFGKLFGNPFREPRIHFAVNCASVGCPMLREEAYRGVDLEQQLEEQARRFLSDRSRNRTRNGRLEVSKIFDWFKEDFEPRDQYFLKYAGILGLPPGASPPLAFLDYDWSLNDFRSSFPR